jgi:hypothetical protein
MVRDDSDDPADSSQRRRLMKSYVVALVLLASATGTALANECPTLQAQIDAAVGTRYDPSAASAKQLASQAWALHQAGKHAESVAMYDEAAKAAGIVLKHKQ